MAKRLMTGIPLFCLMAVMIFARGPWLMAVLTVFAVLGQSEVYTVLIKASFRPATWPGLLFSLLFCPIYYFKGLNGLVVTFAVLCSILIAFSVMMPRKRFLDTLVSIYSLVYPCWFFIFILLLSDISPADPKMSVVGLGAALLSPVVSDIFALLCGRLFGKTKLSPNVSPKKTVEGAVGGLVASTVVLAGFGYLVVRFYYQGIPFWHFPLLGLLCGFMGQCGDLIASALKRFADTKDFGNIFPGHGGVMDRMDSILFASMAAYCYMSMFII
ncbi:MAG: phosphatidate cytidylyltransferase [Eubacteriales bacterium]|nr:phosphatidate cytidylyltransferase [Eubacteriales bacterium]